MNENDLSTQKLNLENETSNYEMNSQVTAEEKPQNKKFFVLVLFLLVSVGLMAYFGYENIKLRQQVTDKKDNLQEEETQNENSTSLNNETVQEPSASLSPTQTQQLIKIPLVSTEGWKTVSNNGVSFKIPADSKCYSEIKGLGDGEIEKIEDEKQCRFIDLPGAKYSVSMIIDVADYKGGSRREQVASINSDFVKYCAPIYVDSLFGNVQALQIARDGGLCQGGGGGIVTVVGNKLVTFVDLAYDPATKEIHRFPIEDTVISTLRPAE